MIAVHQVLFYVGVAAFVGASVFLGLAIYTYFHEDIPAVRDDLTGRRRLAATSEMRRRRANARRSPEIARGVMSSPKSVNDAGGSTGADGAGGLAGAGSAASRSWGIVREQSASGASLDARTLGRTRDVGGQRGVPRGDPDAEAASVGHGEDIRPTVVDLGPGDGHVGALAAVRTAAPPDGEDVRSTQVDTMLVGGVAGGRMAGEDVPSTQVDTSLTKDAFGQESSDGHSDSLAGSAYTKRRPQTHPNSVPDAGDGVGLRPDLLLGDREEEGETSTRAGFDDVPVAVPVVGPGDDVLTAKAADSGDGGAPVMVVTDAEMGAPGDGDAPMTVVTSNDGDAPTRVVPAADVTEGKDDDAPAMAAGDVGMPRCGSS